MNRIAKYVMFDIIRNRFVIGYCLLLFIITVGMLNLEGAKSFQSLLHIVLLVVPLISIIFSTIHFYNSYEFIELMLSQPVKRSSILFSQYLGISFSLGVAFFLGMGVPMLIFGMSAVGMYLLLSGIFLTFIFVALALLCAVSARDKAKGIGVALLIWFFATLIYDAVLLVFLFSFSDYPVEKALLVLISFNPVDLARISVVLQMDTAALMGFSASVYKEFFNSSGGIFASVLIMGLWIVVPMAIAKRIFNRRDL